MKYVPALFSNLVVITCTFLFLGCSTSENECDNGLCVTSTLFCNGQDDCGDESDEKNCQGEIFRLFESPMHVNSTTLLRII